MFLAFYTSSIIWRIFSSIIFCFHFFSSLRNTRLVIHSSSSPYGVRSCFGKRPSSITFSMSGHISVGVEGPLILTKPIQNPLPQDLAFASAHSFCSNFTHKAWSAWSSVWMRPFENCLVLFCIHLCPCSLSPPPVSETSSTERLIPAVSWTLSINWFQFSRYCCVTSRTIIFVRSVASILSALPLAEVP